jgi:hypothetical protein
MSKTAEHVVSHLGACGVPLTFPTVRQHIAEHCGWCADLVRCPACTPIPYVHCAGCRGIGYTSVEDARLINVTLRRH